MYYKFKLAQETDLTGLKGSLSCHARAPWLFCWAVQVQKKTYDCISYCLKEHYVNYHQNRTNKGSSLQLCYFFSCTLILTSTSLHCVFSGFIILQDVYILPFPDLWKWNLMCTVTLSVLPTGSETAAGTDRSWVLAPPLEWETTDAGQQGWACQSSNPQSSTEPW